MTSLHFTSLHFPSLHFTSLYFTSLHFTSSEEEEEVVVKSFQSTQATTNIEKKKNETTPRTRTPPLNKTYFYPITYTYSGQYKSLILSNEREKSGSFYSAVACEGMLENLLHLCNGCFFSGCHFVRILCGSFYFYFFLLCTKRHSITVTLRVT